jgi:hypothetical protein
LPDRVTRTASAFAREHPVLATGAAAALVMAFVARRRRKLGTQGQHASWPMAVATIGAGFLPDILRAIGLALPIEKSLAQNGPPAERESATATP